MKTRCTFFYVALIFLFTNCGDTKAATINEKKGEAATNEKQSADSPITSTSTPTTSGDGIVGTWKLIMEAYDENFNNKLDDEERKTGMQNSTPQSLHGYQMQFNANGSCKIERIYNGTYKINEEGGKKILSVQMEATEGLEKKSLPLAHRKYHIKSLTGSELLLLAEVSGVTYTFWLFKKV